jgi:hypothetical protein
MSEWKPFRGKKDQPGAVVIKDEMYGKDIRITFLKGGFSDFWVRCEFFGNAEWVHSFSYASEKQALDFYEKMKPALIDLHESSARLGGADYSLTSKFTKKFTK